MEPQELSPNGVQRLLKGQSVILQIYDTKVVPVENKLTNIDMIMATVSDGYCYFQNIYLFLTNFPDPKREYSIAKLKLASGTLRKVQKGNLKGNIITDSGQVVYISNKLNSKVGDPIPYQQYIKNGKKNPKGSRKITAIPAQNDDEGEETDDDLTIEARKIQQRLKQKQKNQNKQKQISNQSNSVAFNKNINKNKNNSNSLEMKQVKQQSRTNNESKNSSLPKVNQNQKEKPKTTQNKPIIKIQQQQNSTRRDSIKPQVKHHDGDHQKVKQLFLGMDQFKIVVRLLFVWPLKTIINKKGNQSSILNLQFGDQSGSMMCTAFGDMAQRYQNLQPDNIFAITGASITQQSYKGNKQLRLTIGDATKLQLLSDDPSFPTIDSFCISLKQLNQIDKGRSVNVICMIKQTQLVEFVSKNGNNIKKKVLRMFDLQNQIESQMTLLNEKAQIQYQDGMYALKGVQIDEFMGQKSYKSSLNFVARFLKKHKENQRIKQVDDMTFTCIASNQKPRKQSINSLTMLKQKCQSLVMGQNLWTQVICYLRTIRIGGSSKNFYLSCPHCKKKIQEGSKHCQKCNKNFDKGKNKYLLSINIADNHDNIWVSVYDEGQRIINLPNQQFITADTYAELTQDEIKERVKELRYKRLKLKLVSTKEMYNEQERLKHKVIKVIPMNYATESVCMLNRIKSIMNGL